MLKRVILPLIEVVLCVVTASTAAVFARQARNPSEGPEAVQHVVANGRLLGNDEVQQVVTWHTRGTAHLAVRTGSSRPRVLWQSDSPDTRVNSVRVSDLDGDGVPEILSLWWKRPSSDAALRIFHWNGGRQSFVEIQSDIRRITSYRIVRITNNRSASHIVISARTGKDTRSGSVAYELQGSGLVRVGGGQNVTSQVESGIEGRAIISPIQGGPVRQGIPNSAPYKTTLVVWGAGDREIARLETGSDGRFRVALAPGTYRIGPPPPTGRFLPRASEETVIVEPGKFAQVTIHFDSGMR